jgi:hypothetical protein
MKITITITMWYLKKMKYHKTAAAACRVYIMTYEILIHNDWKKIYFSSGGQEKTVPADCKHLPFSWTPSLAYPSKIDSHKMNRFVLHIFVKF